MKQPAAYYLLLLYCTVLMRCALPVACDALSHIFNEEEHIATVHALYGSHHVQMETAASSESDSNKNQTTPKYEDQVLIHLSTKAYSFTASSYYLFQSSSCFLMIKPKTIFLTKDIPPPKFS